MGETCSIMGNMKNSYCILNRKPAGKRSPGRPRRRWEYTRMDLRERG